MQNVDWPAELQAREDEYDHLASWDDAVGEAPAFAWRWSAIIALALAGWGIVGLIVIGGITVGRWIAGVL